MIQYWWLPWYLLRAFLTFTAEAMAFVLQVLSAAQSATISVQTYNGVGRRFESLTISQVRTYEKVVPPLR